jgi:predicted Fe-Mo cluster-binding NifX family protein
MGSRAQALFSQSGISVVTGAPSVEPEAAAKAYLDGSLVIGDNVCDH